MAQSKKNIATEGLSGKVGNFVFRRRKSDDKIFVSRNRNSIRYARQHRQTGK